MSLILSSSLWVSSLNEFEQPLKNKNVSKINIFMFNEYFTPIHSHKDFFPLFKESRKNKKIKQNLEKNKTVDRRFMKSKAKKITVNSKNVKLLKNQPITSKVYKKKKWNSTFSSSKEYSVLNQGYLNKTASYSLKNTSKNSLDVGFFLGSGYLVDSKKFGYSGVDLSYSFDTKYIKLGAYGGYRQHMHLDYEDIHSIASGLLVGKEFGLLEINLLSGGVWHKTETDEEVSLHLGGKLSVNIERYSFFTSFEHQGVFNNVVSVGLGASLW